MSICKIEDLPDRLPAGTRLLGLDVGEKTIGMALSDSALTLASPIGTIRRQRFAQDADSLFETVDERGVGALVVGLPRNMDGSLGPRAQSTKQFAYNLLKRRDIPAAFWDERLSTQAVERAMVKEADLSRAKRAQRVDTAAAAFILQGALDAIANLPRLA
ncbi:MAG: Holliday junction resolvase RuvX [Pseudomonadota bacterium]